MSSEIAIEVKNLSKCYQIYDQPRDRLRQFVLPRMQQLIGRLPKQYYREFWALKEISFDIKKGETVGIIGRNGSGKSTLLQIITGTLAPTAGSVTTHGRIAALLELGAGFNPEFTGRENVFLNGALLGLSHVEIERHFDEIAAFADIGEYIDQAVKTYSSGMFVRLAFAVQAHLLSDILIVDEALAVGDVFFQQKCARFMRDRLADCTKLLVTHDMHAVHNFCSRVIVVQGGGIVFDGNVREGVEVYLRSSHSDIFRDSSLRTDESLRKVVLPAKSNGSHAIPGEAMGGRGNVKFVAVAVRVNSQLIQSNRSTVFGGDLVELAMDLHATELVENLIVGYLIVDRNGMYVCGDNTLSISRHFVAAKGKSSIIHASFRWPEIASGAYTITLGIGSGDDPLNHVIECWAHSVFAFDAIAHKPVHGLFTNSIMDAYQE